MLRAQLGEAEARLLRDVKEQVTDTRAPRAHAQTEEQVTAKEAVLLAQIDVLRARQAHMREQSDAVHALLESGTDTEISLVALQPCSLAALRPCGLAALRPCSLAALQPCSLVAL